MATERFVQIQPLAGTLTARAAPPRAGFVRTGLGKTCGIDVGSTTCKFVLVSEDGLRRNAVWLAKSKIEIEKKERGVVIVTLPKWLAIEKELV